MSETYSWYQSFEPYSASQKELENRFQVSIWLASKPAWKEERHIASKYGKRMYLVEVFQSKCLTWKYIKGLSVLSMLERYLILTTALISYYWDLLMSWVSVVCSIGSRGVRQSRPVRGGDASLGEVCANTLPRARRSIRRYSRLYYPNR